MGHTHGQEDTEPTGTWKTSVLAHLMLYPLLLGGNETVIVTEEQPEALLIRFS